MPLYKLTEKQLAKRKREDESGISDLKAKMREAGEDGGSESSFGDSGSGTDRDDDEDEEDDDEEEEMGPLDSEDDSSDDEDDAGDDDDHDEEDEDKGGSEPEDGTNMSIAQINDNPIWPLDAPTGASTCIICPGTMFKNDHMVKDHLPSKRHVRAKKRWDERVKQAETGQRPFESDDPREIVDGLMEQIETKQTGRAVAENNDQPDHKVSEGESARRKRRRMRKKQAGQENATNPAKKSNSASKETNQDTKSLPTPVTATAGAAPLAKKTKKAKEKIRKPSQSQADEESGAKDVGKRQRRARQRNGKGKGAEA